MSLTNIALRVYCQPKTLIAALIFFCLPLYDVIGQDIYLEDTISITAVTITAPGSIRHIPFSIASIDSGTFILFQFEDMGYLLQAATPLSVKRYGNFGLASVSMRGLSGSHTLVTWNGISITGPNTGQSDFTLIPVFTASSVLITGGGADLEEISGSIGGKVELSSEPVRMAGTEASFTIGGGSYNEYSSLLTIRTGNERASSNLSVWGKKAKNDFRFVNENDPDGPSELRRTNASSDSKGLMQDLFFKMRKSSFSAHLWYNLTDRELPGPVTTVQQNFDETQDDRSLRSVIRYKTTTGKLTMDLTAGFTNEVNLYNNELADINGDNRSETYTARTRFIYRFNDDLEFTMNLGDEYQTARSLSYEGMKDRNLLSSAFTAIHSPGSRLRLTLQARQILESGRFVAPEFTAGGSFLISGDGRSVIKANISRNLKLPSLNDLYWNPGGAADLDPEVSTGGELGFSYNNVNQSGIRNTFDITMHASGIHDLIQWVPGQFGYWSAANVRSVKVKGIETRLTTVVPVDHGKITAGVNYSLTSSAVSSSDVLNDRSIGKQLIYTPVHHLNANVAAGYHFLRGGAVFVMDSKRFTTADNSEWLPLTCQVNVNLGAAVSTGKASVVLDFAVENLLNAAWESVRNYPMPLRTYMMKMKFNFSKIQKNEKQ